MQFSSISEIKSNGFTGFKTISELLRDGMSIPEGKGVYLILRIDTEAADFLTNGTGGYFKGKNPNVPIDLLKKNWVENTPVVYIGKATSLKMRLKQYFYFGQGKNIGHYGGRYIWQLKKSSNLIVCWKATENDPREAEKELLKDFYNQFGSLPFANLVG